MLLSTTRKTLLGVVAMADSIIKINKFNERILGASLFLSDKDIEQFISTDSTHLKIEKTLTVNGISLKLTPLRLVSKDKEIERKCI